MNSLETRTDCLIIGAGLAGLLAASELQSRGFDVQVLDKGRGVGGRLATRRINANTFDHGAQFFTVREPEFQRHVDEWLRVGVAREWCRGFAHKDGEIRTDGHPRYCGTSGMTAIAKHLAQNLKVETNTRVEKITIENNSWKATTDAGVVWQAGGLVLTPPVPQSLLLIESDDFRLDAKVKEQLTRINYDPCLAVMVKFSSPLNLLKPGAIQIEAGEPVYWIADNSHKGISPEAGALTIHAGAEWSRAHYGAPDALVITTLIERAKQILGDAFRLNLDHLTMSNAQVKRWRYSKPTVTHAERCLITNTPPVVFAGDAFGSPRVEGAALSGAAAAEAVALLLR